MSEMSCVIVSYLTNRISASKVQFRAGSKKCGQGGTTHPAAELIAHPLYDPFTLDFDVAVARASDKVCASLNFLQKQFKLCSNTINEGEKLVYNLKILQ
jgi:hypothetical protein